MLEKFPFERYINQNGTVCCDDWINIPGGFYVRLYMC